MRIKKSEHFSYDSNRNILLCRGRIGLMNTLKMLLPSEININKTLNNIRMAGYIDPKGNQHVFRNYPSLFAHLEKECGLPIVANKCFLTGMAMVSPLFTLVLKEVPERLLEAEPEDTIATVSVEELAEQALTEPEKKEEVKEEKIDIEFAKSLEDRVDVASGKRALANYAIKFGIVLKQNKKFDNMIADLEKAM